MSKNYLLTNEEIKAEAEEILAMIKSNEFPRMVMKNNGVPRKLMEVKPEEFEAAAQIISGNVENT